MDAVCFRAPPLRLPKRIAHYEFTLSRSGVSAFCLLKGLPTIIYGMLDIRTFILLPLIFTVVLCSTILQKYLYFIKSLRIFFFSSQFRALFFYISSIKEKSLKFLKTSKKVSFPHFIWKKCKIQWFIKVRAFLLFFKVPLTFFAKNKGRFEILRVTQSVRWLLSSLVNVSFLELDVT